MQVYHFRFEVDTDIEAESKEEVWEIVKMRMADRFYGPTQDNLEFIKEIPEPAAAIE